MNTIIPAKEMSFNDDCLQLSDFADKLQKYLSVDHIFTPGSLVVGLEAPFGSGKTAFLSMWCKRMHEERTNSTEDPLPVLLNAWEDDFMGDPFFSIMMALIDEIEELQPDKEKLKQLKTVVKHLAWIGIDLANGYIRNRLKIDLLSAKATAEEKAPLSDNNDLEVFELHNKKKQAFNDLKELLQDFFESTQHVKAIVCVDELDRCRPDYAIQYLETIKHIFDIPGIVFVLAIDKDQISNSARALFGSELNANEYLRKFIDRTFLLPKPDQVRISALVDHNHERFIRIESKRADGFDRNISIDVVKTLCTVFAFTLRQIDDLFRLLGHVFSAENPSYEESPKRSNLLLFLCCLKVYDSNFYKEFCQGDKGVLDLMDLLNERTEDLEQILYWPALCDKGMNFGNMEAPSFLVFLQANNKVSDFAYKTKDTDAFEQQVREIEDQLVNGWGHRAIENYISKTHQELESATTLEMS